MNLPASAKCLDRRSDGVLLWPALGTAAGVQGRLHTAGFGSRQFRTEAARTPTARGAAFPILSASPTLDVTATASPTANVGVATRAPAPLTTATPAPTVEPTEKPTAPSPATPKEMPAATAAAIPFLTSVSAEAHQATSTPTPAHTPQAKI